MQKGSDPAVLNPTPLRDPGADYFREAVCLWASRLKYSSIALR